MEILTNPILLSSVFTIAGLLAKHFYPAIIPFMGPAEKVIKELIDLHDKSDEPNNIIIDRAVNQKVKNLLKDKLK